MGLTSNVRCRWCGEHYDLRGVETTGRYADCTVFKTPCCGRDADDREWKSLPDFYRVAANGEPPTWPVLLPVASERAGRSGTATTTHQ